MAALIAGSVVDTHSSLGRVETNPLLRGPSGRFSGRSIAMKASITGITLGMQWLLLRKNPEAEKYATRINFGMAGMFVAAGAYNHAIHRRPAAVAGSTPFRATTRAVTPSFEVPR